MRQDIGPYRVERLIGSGGMGAVYRALDTRLGRRVALKFIRPERAERPSVRERMRREARALSRLNHPGICQVYDLLETPEGDVLVVEWVDGRTLDDSLTLEGPLAPEAALRVLAATARALAVAHAHGVVHRDLKPANIMTTLAGEVKVLDFGLARLVAGETETPRSEASPPEEGDASQEDSTPLTALGKVPGTPGYIAPEASRGEQGPRGDVYALGVTACELLTGHRPPGPGERERALLRKELRAHRPLAALVERMLSPEPRDRPSAAEVADKAEALLAAPGLRRRRTAIFGSLAVAALAVAAAVAWTRPAVRGLTKARPAALAVLPARNETGEPRWDAVVRTGLPELLASALRRNGKLSVLPGALVVQACQEVPLEPELDARALRRLARYLSARLLVDLRVTRHQGAWELTASLYDSDAHLLRAVDLSQRQRALLVQPFAADAAAALLRAIDPLETGLEDAPEPAAFAEEALADYAAALESWRHGDAKGALPLIRRASVAAPAFAPAPILAAAVLTDLSSYEDAEPFAAWGLATARAASDRSAEVEALQRLADVAGRRGNAALELSRLEEAARAAAASGDPLATGRVHDALARYYFRIGEPGKMEKEARLAVEVARQLGHREYEARWRGRIGLALGFSGRRAESLAEHRRSHELARETGDLQTQGTALSNAAGMLMEEGDLPGSEKAFTEVLELFTRLANQEGIANAEMNLAEMALRRGDLATAETRFTSALAIVTRIGDAPGREYALHELGLVHYLKGDLAKAEAAAREALASAEASRSVTTRNNALQVLASVAEARGQTAEAVRVRREALSLVKGTEGSAPFDVAAASLAVARSLLSRQPPELTESGALIQTAEATHEMRVECLVVRARHAELSGDRPRAAAALREALTQAERLEPRRAGEIKKKLSGF